MPRHSCKVNILRPKALDAIGWPVDMAAACERCQGCENSPGELGLENGATIVRSHGAMALEWRCPGCGCVVSEETTALTAKDEARVIGADPLCHKCR